MRLSPRPACRLPLAHMPQAGPGQEGPVAVAVVANGDAEQPGSNGHHDGGDAAMDEAT